MFRERDLEEATQLIVQRDAIIRIAIQRTVFDR